MSVINAILIAIAAMAAVIVITLPLIFAFKGWDAWQAIPQEVYARERMTLFRLPPLVLWVGVCLVSYLGRVCQWLHWQLGYDIFDGFFLGLLGLLLMAHLIWSYRLLRRGESADGRLRLFARYAIVGASVGLLVLFVGVLSKYYAAS